MMSVTPTPHRFVAIALSMACGMSSLSVMAQTIRQPWSNPTVDDLIDALSASGINKATGFRPAPMPDTDHRCQTAAGSTASAGSNKKLVVVPYDGAHPASTNFDRCQAAAGSTASADSNKKLVVVPYDGAHPASTDLAVNFDLGSDRLLPNGRLLLDKLAIALKDERTEQSRFAVAGHTDAVGSVCLNRELSCARAIAVKNYLVGKGISGNRLSAYGFGKDSPLDDAQPDAAVNRRVEIRRDID